MKRLRPVVWVVIALAVLLYFLIPHYFWTRSEPVPGGFNVLSDKSESTLSADGQVLIVARDVKGRGSELYMLRREGRAWGRPQLLTLVNSPFNETDPELTHDGRYLLMASDRPGGGGGYDLWVARWDGTTWRQPLNLGWGVNSRFDEFGPAVSHATNRIYFSSNRPDERLSVSEKNLTDKELRRRFPSKDLDIYYADNIGETLGKPVTVYALRDRRQLDEDLAIRLGGNPGTEAAVQRALAWMASVQEADGRWAIGRHGGQAGHDVAATALTLLALMGHGHKHNEPGPYREQVDRGLKWLVKSTRPDGDMRSGNVNNGMYDQGMGTMALTEAYGLTRDASLRQAAQAAINFVVSAQDKNGGGWRYQPGQAGDMSVFGWQVMALNNALNAGLDVPAETLALAEKWLSSVGSGQHNGLYGYQRGGRQPAMVAEGMFCRQLLRTPRNSLRMNETAGFIEAVDVRKHGQPFYYFIYYTTLGLYHHHIEYWDTWNGELKDLLLDSQVKTGDLKGSWPVKGAHGGSMGRLLCTGLATLSLEIYYRYLPRYEFLEPEMADIMAPAPGSQTPAAPAGQSTNDMSHEAIASVATTNSLIIPLFGAAWNLASVNTSAHEAQPSVSADGRTLFFASVRTSGRGGADLYVSRLEGDEFGEARPLRGYLNTSADETDPVVAADGVSILMSSNRESSSGARYRLYQSEYRRVTPITFLRNATLYLLSLLARTKWWLLVLLLVIAGILFLAKQFADPSMRERYNLLQKCILGSIFAHLLILLLTAFWKISTEVVSPTDERLEIAIDVNALAQEALAIDIREDISELPEAESAALAEQMEAPPPVQEIDPVESEIEPIEVETPKEVLALEAPEIESPPEVVVIDLPEPEVVLASIEMMETAFALEEAPAEKAVEPPAPETPREETMTEPLDVIPESKPEKTEIAAVPTQQLPEPAPIEMEKPIEVARVADLPELEETPVLEQPLEVKLPEMETLESRPSKPEESPQIEHMAHRAEQPDVPEIDAEPTQAPLPSIPPEPETLSRSESLLAKLLEEADLTTDIKPVPLDYTNMTFMAALPLMKMEEGRPDETERVASPEPVPAKAPARLTEPALMTMDHGQREKAAMPSPEQPAEITDSATPIADPAVEESQPSLEFLTASRPARTAAPAPAGIQIEMERPERAMPASPATASSMPSQFAVAVRSQTTIDRGMRENVDVAAVEPRVQTRESAMPRKQRPAEESRASSETLLASTLAMVKRVDPAEMRVEMETPARQARATAPSRHSPMNIVARSRPAELTAELGALVAESAMASPSSTPAIRTSVSAVSVSANNQTMEPKTRPEALSTAETAPIDALRPVEVQVSMERGQPRQRPQDTSPGRRSASSGTRRNAQAELGVMGTVRAEVMSPEVPQGAVPDRASRVNAARPVEMISPSHKPLAAVTTSRPLTTRVATLDFQLETRQAAVRIGSPGGMGNLIAMVSAGHVLPAPTQQLRGRAGSAEMVRAGVTFKTTAAVSRSTRAGAPIPVEGYTTQPGISEVAFIGNPNVPVTKILDDMILDDAPAVLTPYYLREPGRRGTVINRLGGGSDTEAAVRLALDWFISTQEIDGHWSITRFGGQRGHDAGATGFVLLSYLGWGASHDEEGPYRDSLSRGLDWLLAKMKSDGDLRDTDADNAMYSQGIATLALAEAFALTKDEKLREPAQRAVNFIVAAQNEKDGSWRYQPGDPGDTSVLGWQLMALTSARLAGLHVPEETMKNIERWLKKVGGGSHGGLYGYRNNAPVSSMVAEGMFCRQLLGTSPDSPIMKESALHISSTPVDLESKTLPVYYYTYYGTLALHQQQGPAWQSWNANMKRALLGAQNREGDKKGSWEPRGLYAERTGRLVATAMATLTLEVYYRYLPLYTFNADSEENPD